MKKLKFLLPIILSLTVLVTLFIVSQLPAEAATSGTCGDNVTWSFDEATGTLTISGTGEMDDYEYWYTNAPSPWHSTMRNFIKTVKISDGVTSIGNYAFYSCLNLTSINIPDSVTTIGDNAFHSCYSLTNITVPDSVTSIGTGAFIGCYKITSITIPDSVTSIGTAAFQSCESLTSITVPDSVTSIGKDTFYGCKSLTEITIPDGVTSIGDNAFHSCYSLTNITIGNNVTSIAFNAFSDCNESLKSITVGDRNTKYHSRGNCLIETATGTLILGCKNSVIPTNGSVTRIGANAFSDCSNLASINIPHSVTSVEDWAFSYCDKLTSVTIGNGVTSIGSYAFWGCYSLTSVTIGKGVANIADHTFYDCNNLKTVYVSSSNIVANLTSSDSCGELIYYADTVCIKSTITNIPSYITANYPYTAMTIKNGVTYTAYSKNPIEHMCYYGTKWSSDTNDHWFECSCGKKFELAPHSWNDGETTTKPSTKSEGEKTFTCTVCSSTKTKKLDKIETPDKDNSIYIIIISAVVIVAIIGVCVVIVIKKKKA